MRARTCNLTAYWLATIPMRPALLVSPVLVFVWVAPSLAQKPPAANVPAPVVADVVQQRDVVIENSFVGTVVPRRTSVVGSTVEGRVTEFLVREGDFVHAGQPLARLRLTALEIELAGAQAELALLEHQLEDLQVSQPEEIKQAEARMSAAKALQEYANRQLQRGKILVTSRAITTEELEEMISQADAAMQTLLERTSAHELTVVIAPVKQHQAEARIRVQQELIRGLEDAIAEHTIVAPFDGYVTKEHTEVGQWIAKGGSVAELVEVDSVEIEVNVLETYISELRQRNETQEGTKTLAIHVDALPTETFTGEIVSIVPRADVQSRTFPVKIRVQNRTTEDGQVRLKPGMFARVTLPVRTIPNAIMIPKDALVLGQRTPVAWVIVPRADADPLRGDAVRPVAVEVDYGISQGDLVQVVGPIDQLGAVPLQSGELVVTEGNERLNPKSTVQVTKKSGTP